MILFSPDQLSAVTFAILRSVGATDSDARVVADHLVKNSVVGHEGHGMSTLGDYVRMVRSGVVKCDGQMKVVKDMPGIGLIDGGWTWGQKIAEKGMGMAIEKAKKVGIGAVGAFNVTHIGRLGAWSAVALDHDMIGIVFVNGDPAVAPFGGMKPLLGTNPMSIAIPAEKCDPIIIDFATSASAEGKIKDAYLKGEKIPEGWMVDSKGKVSTNPGDYYAPPMPPLGFNRAGAQLPMGGLTGGYKGFGLSLAMDAIAGALTGTGVCFDVTIQGAFFQAINISAFSSVNNYKSLIDKLILSAKGIPKMEGVKEILIPGEPEKRSEVKNLRDGVPVPEATWKGIIEMGKTLDVDVESIVK